MKNRETKWGKVNNRCFGLFFVFRRFYLEANEQQQPEQKEIQYFTICISILFLKKLFVCVHNDSTTDWYEIIIIIIIIIKKTNKKNCQSIKQSHTKYFHQLFL